jgi:signal transduction histidine kinase
MTLKSGFRTRILISFMLFSMCTAVLYAIFVDVILNQAEDEVFNNHLRTEVTHYLDRLRNDPSAAPPNTRSLRGFIGIDNLPPDKRKRVAGLDEGYYETDGPFGLGGPGNYHVAVKRLPDQKKTLYLFLDIGELEVTLAHKRLLTVVSIIGVCIVCVIAFVLSVMVSKRITAPLHQLLEKVKRAEPDNLPTNISESFKDEEILILTRALDRSMHRIKGFLEREKRFTRDASHELRTPVTIIRGAVEILQQCPEYQKGSIRRPLDRIDRAVRDMEEIIETFLWLGRSEAAFDPDQKCDLTEVVRQMAESYGETAAEKGICIELKEDAAPLLSAPPAIPLIVISNLLRNAVHFTPFGKITITLQKDRLTVADTGRGIPSEDLSAVTKPHVKDRGSPGFGLGLDIVKRLCERFGWTLDIKSREGTGTEAIWVFGHQLSSFSEAGP